MASYSKSLNRSVSILSFILPVILLIGCGPDPQKKIKDVNDKAKSEVIIFHAGSLSVPFKEIARQFEAENPGTRILLEAAGSVDCARKITELKKPCDLMASSDYKVIEKFLIPDHTSWHIPFVSNEMVIAFHDGSRRSGEINSDNWTEILSDPEVRFARSDPASDPCGYRTLMTFQLAEKHYKKPGLEKILSRKDTRYIRPKEVDLIALLEVGEIDYFFIYRSVAMQHNLKYIRLPEAINLKDISLSDLYHEALVEIPGKEPGDVVSIHGEPMIYSITMLEEAPNPEGALKFLQFLLDPGKGMAVMEKMGQEMVIPSQSNFYDQTPDDLKKYLIQ